MIAKPPPIPHHIRPPLASSLTQACAGAARRSSSEPEDSGDKTPVRSAGAWSYATPTRRENHEETLYGAGTVETHVTSIFNKLRLAQAPDDHRRALAVLAYPRSEQ